MNYVSIIISVRISDHDTSLQIKSFIKNCFSNYEFYSNYSSDSLIENVCVVKTELKAQEEILKYIDPLLVEFSHLHPEFSVESEKEYQFRNHWTKRFIFESELYKIKNLNK